MPAASMVRPSAPPSPKPSKPLLRRATLSGTVRKSDDLDEDVLSAPTSPIKRARVTFDDNVQEQVIPGRSFELIRAEVRRAIEGHVRGDSEEYDILKDIFAPRRQNQDDDRDISNEEMRKYVLAVTNSVSLLGNKCSGLVKAVLGCEWLGRDEAFVKAYVHLLGNLASAQGTYVKLLLENLVVLSFSGVRLSSGRLPGYPDVSRTQMTSRVHTALKYLLRVVPSGSGTLSPILKDKFPSHHDSKKIHVTYIDNLVRVLDYAPELKSDIYSLITDKVIKIDVQMQVDLDDLDDEVVAAIAHATSLRSSGQLDDDDEDQGSDDSDADSVTSDDDIADDAKRIKEVQGNVEKMDAILDLLFTLYEPYFSNPKSVEAVDMFDTLLGHFQHIILPSYRSRHTQFLLFHFAQTTENLVDNFAGLCVQIAFEGSRPAVLRQSAAAYLASFVARGAKVERNVVRTVFDIIGSHLEDMRCEHEEKCRGPNLKSYTTFYAMTQALLYIFCFRWRDLVDSSEVFEDDDPIAFLTQDLTWAPGVKENLSRLIYSKLNPLKICSPPIVSEFAKIAHHLRFLYVYPLLETNKRIRLSQFASAASKGALRDTGNGNNSESWHQLDAYFPFDPYQLPVSKRWVEDDYVQWQGIPGLNQEEDDEDESGDEENDDAAAEEEDTATDEDDDE